MEKKEEYFVDGFIFDNEKDANFAQKETEGIEYLKSQIDLKDPEKVRQLYCKLVEQRYFRGIIGLVFLKEMQEYLLEQSYIKIEKVPPIHVKNEDFFKECSEKKRKEEQTKENKSISDVRVKKVRNVKADKKLNFLLKPSVILNAVLVICICIMFYIVTSSGNVNIINYQEALENKYSSWEDDLTNREKAIMEKEEELGIN